MSDKGEVIQVGAVRFQRTLPGPVEKVWSHLTECDKLIHWYGEDGNIEGRGGGAVWLMGGHIRGVVTQWKPHRQLTYTWNVFDPGEEESHYPESYLDFELQPRGDVIALTLLHLPVPERFDRQTRVGWHTFLDLLEAALRGEEPRPREAFMAKNAALYGVDLDNLEK